MREEELTDLVNLNNSTADDEASVSSPLFLLPPVVVVGVSVVTGTGSPGKPYPVCYKSHWLKGTFWGLMDVEFYGRFSPNTHFT